MLIPCTIVCGPEWKGRDMKKLIWTAGVVLLLMLLIPPWTHTLEGRPSGDLFYQEIIPGPKPPHCANNATCGVKVAMGRLGIQLAMWAVLFGVPIVYRVRRKNKG